MFLLLLYVLLMIFKTSRVEFSQVELSRVELNQVELSQVELSRLSELTTSTTCIQAQWSDCGNRFYTRFLGSRLRSTSLLSCIVLHYRRSCNYCKGDNSKKNTTHIQTPPPPPPSQYTVGDGVKQNELRLLTSILRVKAIILLELSK